MIHDMLEAPSTEDMFILWMIVPFYNHDTEKLQFSELSVV